MFRNNKRRRKITVKAVHVLIGSVAIALELSAVGGEIAIPDAATTVEGTAAQELADALQRVTGTSYEVRPESAAAGAG